MYFFRIAVFTPVFASFVYGCGDGRPEILEVTDLSSESAEGDNLPLHSAVVSASLLLHDEDGLEEVTVRLDSLPWDQGVMPEFSRDEFTKEFERNLVVEEEPRVGGFDLSFTVLGEGYFNVIVENEGESSDPLMLSNLRGLVQVVERLDGPVVDD
ncbi:MAG: hypothetical protein AAFQ65_01360 [Myxococcota bacterium]